MHLVQYTTQRQDNGAGYIKGKGRRNCEVVLQYFRPLLYPFDLSSGTLGLLVILVLPIQIFSYVFATSRCLFAKLFGRSSKGGSKV